MLYCRVEPEHSQAGPERAASAKMPAHHARAGNHIDLPKYERSKPANKVVHSTSYRYRREMRQPAVPRAAHPQRNETRHADNADAADFQLCILSQGECSRSRFAPSHDTNAILLHDRTTKLRKIRPRPYPVTKVQANILSREAQKIFENSAKVGTSVHFDTLSIPIRYPISKEFAATFTTHLATFGPLVESVGRLQHDRRLTWKSRLNRSKARARLERTDD